MHSKSSVLSLLVICSLYCLVSISQAADIYLIPITANVPHSIAGGEITLQGANATITLEVKVGGWGPVDTLRLAQARIRSVGYTSGSGGSLAPLTTPNVNAGAFIENLRPDFVHFGFAALFVVDTSSLNYRFASTTEFFGEGTIDTGELRYLGTLKLVASADAFGTFTVAFDPALSTIDNEVNIPITPIVLHSAQIRIAPRIFVNDNATGSNNGSSWANAFLSLQDALDLATPGSEIWVAEGTYKPDLGVGITPGDRNATFQLLNNVAVYGGFNGTETSLDQRNPATNGTTLSGDLADNDQPGFVNYVENSIHVVTGSGTNSTAVLDGFTCTGGNADLAQSGGGMILSAGSPTIRSTRFFRNRSNNSGGGIFSSASSARLIDCRFVENQADSGGGVSATGSGSPLIVNGLFHLNSCTGAGPNKGGGAVEVQNGGSVYLINSIVSGNSAQDAGGGIHVNGSSSLVDMRNCSIVANSVAGPGAAGVHVRPTSSGALLENCIVHGNIGSQIDAGGPATVNYSLVQGGFGGTQNIDADPVFVDADGADNVPGNEDDDLRLDLASPCIDAGSRAAVPVDSVDLDGDGNTSELTPLDRGGHPRFRNEPSVFDTGAGGIPVPDVGAHEFQPAFIDCNNNGVPDDLDIFFGTSVDVNMDGIPDECVVFDNGCFPVPDWSCGDNWDLGGDYPDNGTNNYSVVIEGPQATVCLDVDVEVDTVLLENGASLDMSGAGDCVGNMDLAAPGGLVVTNDASLVIGPGQSIGEGDSPSGADMTISGNADVQVNDSTITLTGDVLIASGGAYLPLPPEETNTASFTGGSVTITNDPVAEAPPGEMLLTGQMTLTVIDELILDGSYAEEPCEPHGRAARTFHTPPSLIVRNQAVVNVGGPVGLISSVELHHGSGAPMTVGQDFMNHCITSECVDFSEGAGVVLDGSGNLQLFEAAARDLGATGDVFLGEYAMPSITVASGARVEFVDQFDNDQLGQGPCTEAVYVENLVLDAQTIATINDCRVYYKAASIDPTAMVLTLGCGELKSIDCVTAQPVAPEGVPAVKTRFISFVPGNAGVETALRVTFTSLHHPSPPYTGGLTVPFTAFEGESQWVGPPGTYLESTASGTPFFAASLQCTPHYQDWAGMDLLHVTGSGIAPSSAYLVQAVSVACSASNEEYFSTALAVATSRWGDVESPYNPPDGSVQPDVTDISALVNKFRSVLGAPIKARAMLAGAPGNAFGEITPAVLGVDIGFGHVSACVDAFRGAAYPFRMGKCTGAPVPPATGACAADLDCSGNNGTGPCVMYCP